MQVDSKTYFIANIVVSHDGYLGARTIVSYYSFKYLGTRFSHHKDRGRI